MRDPDKQETTVQTWYAQSWCPWTWDPGFWGVVLVLFGVGLVIAEVFELDRFWEIGGGALIAATGVSLLRAPYRRR